MRPSRILLVVLSLAVLVTFAAACAGGGGSAEPCCNATGSTDQPAQGPAVAFADTVAAGHLTAQPIVFDGAACANVQADRPLLAGFHTVGKAAPVSLTGRYTVSIDQSAAGQQVYVLISDSAGARSIGFVPAEQASNGYGTYHVAPIKGSPAPDRVGESTLEAAYWCYLLANNPTEAQQAGPAAIRAAIGPDISVAFPVDTGLPALDPIVAAGSKPVDALIAFAPTLKLEIKKTFAIAERMVDTCRDGNDPPGGTPGISCKLTDPDHDRMAEFYRGWAVAHVGPQLGLSFGPGISPVMAAVADQLDKSVTAVIPPGLQYGLHLRAEMFRFEAEAAAIDSEAQALGLPSANIVKAGADAVAERVVILQQTSSAGISAAGLALAQQIIADLSANTTFGADTSCSKIAIVNTLTNDISTAEGGLANDTQTILDRYLTAVAGGTLVDDADAQLGACTSIANNAVERRHWATIFFYATLSAASH